MAEDNTRCICTSFLSLSGVLDRQTCEGHRPTTLFHRGRILPSLAPDKTREAACQAGTRQAMWGSGHPNSRQGPPRHTRQACAQRADPWIWVDASHDEGLASEAMPCHVSSVCHLENQSRIRCCVLCRDKSCIQHTKQKGANSNESQRPSPVQSSPRPSRVRLPSHLVCVYKVQYERPPRHPAKKKNVKLQICARSTPMARMQAHSGHAACEALAKHNACTALVKHQKPTTLRAHGISKPPRAWAIVKQFVLACGEETPDRTPSASCWIHHSPPPWSQSTRY